MIAAVSGSLLDGWAADGGTVISAPLEDPNFEQLEMEGLEAITAEEADDDDAEDPFDQPWEVDEI